jgi:transketolase
MMRNEFVQALTTAADAHDDVMLVVGDLGYSVVEQFAERHPSRFLNAGVAEQNMAGLAAGLAMAGLRPFIYSIANFPTLRCLEQIRNDIVYHTLPVTVVAVGGGLGYGALGYSHHAVQDIACLRTLPGMLMLTPGDAVETVAVTSYLMRTRRPAYLRLGKGGEPVVCASPVVIHAPGPRKVVRGNGDAVLACGNVLPLAVDAAHASGASAWSCPVWDGSEGCAAVIREFVARHRRVVVVEEHLAAGGFGSWVRECLEPVPELQGRVRCLAIAPEVCGTVAGAATLRAVGGVTVDGILRLLQ